MFVRPADPKLFVMVRGAGKVVLATGLAVLLTGAGCSSSVSSGDPTSSEATQRGNSSASIAVSVAKPDVQDIADRITLPGTVTPYEQVTLYAKVTGYLTSLSVDIGDHVRKGQLLAEIDVPEMTASLEEKRAALVKAEAEVEQSQAGVGQYEAELEFQRTSYQQLSAIRERDPDVLPKQEVDQARAGFAVAESKLRTAQANVAVAEASLSAARAAIETLDRLVAYSRIEAPLSGVVTERFVDPGALVQAATSSRTQVAPIVALARVDRVRVVTDVPEPNAPYVQRGTRAQITIAGPTGKPIPALVARTGTVLDPATRTMRVEFDVANAEMLLRPGMTARVVLELRAFEDAVTVPVSALHTRGAESAVFVVKDEVAERRLVQTGVESAAWIHIVTGLGGDEGIVVSSAEPLTDGARVQVNR